MDIMQLHFFVKEASKAKEFKKKVMIGAGAVGAGIAGVNEYKRGRKNKKGLTNRDIQNMDVGHEKYTKKNLIKNIIKRLKSNKKEDIEYLDEIYAALKDKNDDYLSQSLFDYLEFEQLENDFDLDDI